MLVYAGIDEAGYGPMLGPLCVGCCAFTIADHDAQAGKPDLWKTLSRAVCRKKSDKKRRVAVDDSKNLKGSNSGKAHPLTHLERGVLAFIADGESHAFPETDDALFDTLGATLPGETWYDSAAALPVAGTADALRIAAAWVQTTLLREGVALAYRGCEAVDVEAFNTQVDQTGSKACVNFAAAMRHVDRIWTQFPGDHPRIIIDRHGGRTHYREELQFAFPGTQIRIVAEEPTVSRYVLDRDGSQVTITFTTEAEARHLPVALASMIAKYVRELAMARMNRFFRAIQPELKPTAGYVQDGRRFLAEIEPILTERSVDRRCLVRSC